jgi:hypothetical protein
MKKVFVLLFLIVAAAGMTFAIDSAEETKVDKANNATQDWVKVDKATGKRRWKYAFQFNYTDYSYEMTQKANDTIDNNTDELKVKCETDLVGMSFNYEKQYESGFFHEGALIYGKGSGNLTLVIGENKAKLKLDSVHLFEWKAKLGMLIPLDQSGNFKAGPFSGFDLYTASFNTNGKSTPDGHRTSFLNSFFAFPLGIRTEYAKNDWKFGLDLEYDFIMSEDSFKLLNSTDFDNEWSNGHIFQISGNISKGFSEGRLTFKLSPFYRFVDYGECSFADKTAKSAGADGIKKNNIEYNDTGASQELGVKVGVQF